MTFAGSKVQVLSLDGWIFVQEWGIHVSKFSRGAITEVTEGKAIVTF